MLSTIAAAVEAEAKRKMAAAKIGNENANKEKQVPQLVAPVVSAKKSENETRQKAAEIFNTNRHHLVPV